MLKQLAAILTWTGEAKLEQTLSQLQACPLVSDILIADVGSSAPSTIQETRIAVPSLWSSEAVRAAG